MMADNFKASTNQTYFIESKNMSAEVIDKIIDEFVSDLIRSIGVTILGEDVVSFGKNEVDYVRYYLSRNQIVFVLYNANNYILDIYRNDVEGFYQAVKKKISNQCIGYIGQVGVDCEVLIISENPLRCTMPIIRAVALPPQIIKG